MSLHTVLILTKANPKAKPKAKGQGTVLYFAREGEGGAGMTITG